MHSPDLNAPPPSQGPLDALSDAELYTALDATVLYRTVKQQELPPGMPGAGAESKPNPDAVPPEASMLDWQILQSEALLTKFYRELCRRDPSHFKMPAGLILARKEGERASTPRACPRLLRLYLRCSCEEAETP